MNKNSQKNPLRRKNKPTLLLDNNPEVTTLCNQIEEVFIEKIGNKPLPSLEEQLDRLTDL